ncbi:TPM domain-containing protein [Prevotellaceae bacterium LCP21S3_C11]|uniref:TPM domain-containing protein n=1 Tax=Segatella hominis TaxID=2518605 RepID=UPI000337F253|nr:TPM domain-containing protein [Segatella hominis]WOZ81839.1 TPM domain-containing protein [Segatella hominis]CDA54824.1 putative uncharacterized protein [Prevotella sp. CAG:604]
MRFKRFFILLLMIVSVFSSSFAQREWSAENVPIPYLKDSTQYVSDPDGYLSKDQKDSANFYLQKLNLECGVQNVLVIVGHVKDQDAFRMSQDIGEKYGIGYKKTRRGLVMVIAVEDHKYFIAPGMGLEGELTDVDCDDIARACIVKYMRLNQPGMAVVTVSRSIYNKVKSGRTGIPDVDDGPIGEDEWGFIIFFLIICFGIPLYLLIRYILEECGVIKKKPSSGKSSRQHKRHDDDWFPPFFLGGGGGFSGGSSSGGGFSGGSFGGGSFGGGGSGGGW